MERLRAGFLILTVAAAAGAAGCGRSAVQAANESYRGVAVRTAALERTVRLTGTVVAGRQAVLLAPVLRSNRHRGERDSFQLLLRKLAPPGAWVRRGDVVAEFDPQYLALHLDNRQAVLNDQQALFRSLLAQLKVSREAYDQRMFAARGAMDKAGLERRKAPVLSDMQAERDRLAFEEARARYGELNKSLSELETSHRAQVRGAELDLEEAKLELERARTGLERLQLRATIDGIAVPFTIRRGSQEGLIQEGDELRVGQAVVQIVDVRTLVVHARVNQVDAGAIKAGARARVGFDIFPEVSLPARVVYVGAIATAGRRPAFVRELPVRLALEKSDHRIVPNLTASADVVIEDAPAAPLVPIECVQTDSEASYVVVRTPAGWEKRQVTIGTVNHVDASVVAGLSAGETVGAPQ